jgi:hypothetical protein
MPNERKNEGAGSGPWPSRIGDALPSLLPKRAGHSEGESRVHGFRERARDRSGIKTRRVFVRADSPVPAAGGDAPNLPSIRGIFQTGNCCCRSPLT